jgi:hypothetical protein
MFYKSHSNGIYLVSILVFVKCEFVWSPFDMCCLQPEAARIVTGLPICSSAESLYFGTGWSKLEDRRKSRKLNLFYKIENNMYYVSFPIANIVK